LGVGDSDTNVVTAVILTMILDYFNMIFGLIFAGSPKLV